MFSARNMRPRGPWSGPALVALFLCLFPVLVVGDEPVRACSSCEAKMKKRGYNHACQAITVTGSGTTAADAASSAFAILGAYPNSQSGVYWIDVPGGVGPTQLYCDMRGGGWMLVMRGTADDPFYGDTRWQSSGDNEAADLSTGAFGAFAKSAAFASYASASRLLLVAGGFNGRGADGVYRWFEFTFGDAAATPQNLMFTSQHRMSWNGSYSLWRQTFGQDRTQSPMFQRGGSSANQDVGADRVVQGCGQPMMFGFQASDGNDVNSGVGPNADYCGRGYAGTGGFFQIWIK